MKLREAVRLQPQWAEARYSLAFALNRLGRHTEALSVSQALELSPSSAPGSRQLVVCNASIQSGVACLNSRESGQAISHTYAAIESFPTDPIDTNTLNMLTNLVVEVCGDVIHNTNVSEEVRLGQALDLLKALASVAPTQSVPTLCHLAISWMEQSMHEQAFSVFELVLEGELTP